MALINPFKSLKYNQDKVSMQDVIAPPYDIIDDELQKSLHDKNPYNIINLILGYAKEGDDENNNRYTRAREALDSWKQEGVLVEDEEDFFYILKQEFKMFGQMRATFGIIANVKLHNWEEGVILPHEKTLDKPKEDRLKLMKATDINLSPIYMLFEDEQKNINDFIAMYTEINDPIFSFTDTDEVINTMWNMPVEKCGAFTDVLNQQKLYIADGHHRYETALEYKKYRQAKDGDGADKNASYNYIMTYITGALEGRISLLPTHRMLINVGVDKITSLVDNDLNEHFNVKKVPSYERADALVKESYDKHAFIIYSKNDGFVFITLKDGLDKAALLNVESKALAELDVKILHTLVLENILGITVQEQADGTRIRYTRDNRFAISEVDAGNCEAAIILERTPLKSIIEVSNDREVMPQKSTYFFPKLPSGMVMKQM